MWGGREVCSLSLTHTHTHTLSVAQQCLSEAYGIDLGDATQRAKYEVKPTLEVILFHFNSTIVVHSAVWLCVGAVCRRSNATQ